MEITSNIGNLFALSHDPVVVAYNGIVTYMNPPARNLFGRDLFGEPETELLPGHLLTAVPDCFVASTVVNGQTVTVTRTMHDSQYLYSFVPPSPKEDESIFHSVSSSMRELTSGIKTNADLIKAYSLNNHDPALQMYSAVLNHFSAKLKRLVNNYTLFSAFKQKTQQYRPAMCSVSKICQEISNEVSDITLPRNIKVECHASSDVIALVDEELLVQMLMNLISNSLMHMPNGGTVHLRASSNGKMITFEVEDNGSGIPEEIMANVFKAYSLPMDLTSGTFNTGLGLSVADSVAKIHGGTLIIESKPNVGTRVIVQIPRITDTKLMSPKPAYKIPMRDFIMTDLSTWLSWEDYLILS